MVAVCQWYNASSALLQCLLPWRRSSPLVQEVGAEQVPPEVVHAGLHIGTSCQVAVPDQGQGPGQQGEGGRQQVKVFIGWRNPQAEGQPAQQ